MGRTAKYEAGYSRKTGVERGSYSAADVSALRRLMRGPRTPATFAKHRVARLIRECFVEAFTVPGARAEKLRLTPAGEWLVRNYVEPPLVSLGRVARTL